VGFQAKLAVTCLVEAQTFGNNWSVIFSDINNQPRSWGLHGGVNTVYQVGAKFGKILLDFNGL
jgi:hypothetical protein